MTRFNRLLNIVALSSLLLLTACGSSSSSSSSPSNSETNNESDVDSNTSADSDNENNSSSDCVITSDEQEMLDQVNQARSSSRSCGADAMPAVASVSWNCQLRDTALGHSKDMLENNFFDHTGSNGLSVGNRATESGYVWRSVGENIAAGQTSITQVMTGWINSPGHCRNIMAAGFTEFGSAVVLRSQTNSEADYSHYWTQVFAAPR